MLGPGFEPATVPDESCDYTAELPALYLNNVGMINII